MSENIKISKEESARLKESTKAFIEAFGSGSNEFSQGGKVVVTFSPYAKVFNPCEKIEKYIEDTSKLLESKDDLLTVSRSEGAFVFKVGKPYEVEKNVSEWLVGLSNELTNKENDWTGFVYLEIPDDLLSAYKYMLQGKKIDKEDQTKIESFLEKARGESMSRSLKFIKTLYNTFMMSRSKMKSEFNVDPGIPNDMELLLSFILKEEVKKRNEKRMDMMTQFNEANRIIGGIL